MERIFGKPRRTEKPRKQRQDLTDRSHASRPERSSFPNDQDLHKIVEKKWPNIHTPKGRLRAIRQGLEGRLNSGEELNALVRTLHNDVDRGNDQELSNRFIEAHNSWDNFQAVRKHTLFYPQYLLKCFEHKLSPTWNMFKER